MTYRDVLHKSIGDVAYASIGGGPWADEVEQGLTDIKSAIDVAIDGNALLADIFNRQVRSPEDEVDDDEVPF